MIERTQVWRRKRAYITLLLFALFIFIAINPLSAGAAQWFTPREIWGANMASDDIATALESNGTQWAVWKDSPTGQYWQIYYSYRSPDGLWNYARAINPKPNNSYFTSLAIAPDNTKFVVWQERVGALMQIGYVQFTNEPGARQLLPGNGAADYHPAAAVDRSGTRHIVFSRGGTIYHAQSAPGNSWRFDRVSAPSSHYYYPQIAIDDFTGLIHVVYWSDNKSIYYTQRPLRGGAWSNTIALGGGKDPNVTVQKGKVFVSWSDSRNAYRLATRTFKKDKWQSVVYVSNLTGSFRSHAVLDSKGKPHLIWMQNIDGRNYDIYYADLIKRKWTAPKAIRRTYGFDEGNDLVIDSKDVLHAVYLEMTSHKSAFSSDRSGAVTAADDLALAVPTQTSLPATRGISPTRTPNTATPAPKHTRTPRPMQTPQHIEDGELSLLSYEGTWHSASNAQASDGAYHTCDDARRCAGKAVVKLTVKGSKVEFGTAYGNEYGMIEIAIDKRKQETVDLCKPNPQNERPLFANITIALPNDGASHVLQVQSIKAKSSYCAKSARGFVMDHFEVYP